MSIECPSWICQIDGDLTQLTVHLYVDQNGLKYYAIPCMWTVDSRCDRRPYYAWYDQNGKWICQMLADQLPVNLQYQGTCQPQPTCLRPSWIPNDRRYRVDLYQHPKIRFIYSVSDLLQSDCPIKWYFSDGHQMQMSPHLKQDLKYIGFC